MKQLMRFAYASFLLFALTSLIAPLAAQAAETPALRVDVAGTPTKYMTVYFARGRAPLIGTADKQILLNEIKAKIRVTLTGTPVVIPSRTITKQGIFSAFNYLVLVFHNQENFVWLNADDSLPENESSAGTPQARKVMVLDALEVGRLPLDADGLKRIQIDAF